jgi:beta-glucosidase
MTRTFQILLTMAAAALAASTTIDTLLVPVHNLKFEGTSAQGSTYSGRVLYDLLTGDNDSLQTTLSFVPVGAGAAVELLDATGDVGSQSILTGAGGRKEILFHCRINGTQAAQYRARLTIVADRTVMEKQVDSLLALMTLDEKISQVHGGPSSEFTTATISRLNIPGFQFSDGPFGLGGGNGPVTLFPAAIAWANTWDTALVRRIGAAIGEEFRAKGRYVDLGPMVNMVRNIDGGRNFESYGEDPYLTGKIAAADIRGLQSVGTIATPKHFICNDREWNRDFYSSDVNERTLREIYALPFEMAIKEGGAWSIMSSYNRVNSVYASEYPRTLTDLLKTDWGFRGFEVSDWGGTHSTVASANAGHDVEMPSGTYFGAPLQQAVTGGQVSLATLDDKVRRTLRARIWAGVRTSPITQYAGSVNSPEHQALALEAARKSLVLVKNTGSLLPLSKTGTIAVVGPYADTGLPGGRGSSQVQPAYLITPRQGIINRIGATHVTTDYANADAAIVFVGNPNDGEYGDRCGPLLSNMYLCGPPLTWIGDQNQLVQTVMAANPRTVVVYVGGCPSYPESWTNAPAIMVAFYPGEEQGNAMADALFGDYNPAGRLCVSWPVAASQSVNWNEVNNDGIGMHIAYEQPSEGPGYRYLDRHNLTPTWPFGHGLSYTTFEYTNLRVSPQPAFASDHITVTADVRNSGGRVGEEVAELYISQTGAAHRPVKELKGFSRFSLNVGETKTVSFELNERDFAWYDTTKSNWVVDAADFRVMVGPSSGNLPLQASFRMGTE